MARRKYIKILKEDFDNLYDYVMCQRSDLQLIFMGRLKRELKRIKATYKGAL